MIQAFKAGGNNTALALTTTLTSVPSAAAMDGDGENVLIFNNCTVPVTVEFGVTAPTATVASPYVVPASSRMLVTVGRVGALWCAAMPIGAATASVYLTRGDGMEY